MTFALAADVTPCSTRVGSFLVGERPLRVVRVSKGLYRLLSKGGTLEPATRAQGRALESLARAGYLKRYDTAEDSGRDWPAVSVVIPVKDRAGELGRCLESLDYVQYPREQLEVIVVDDGSVDESPAVARGHGVRVVPSGGRGTGPASARNQGARQARGEILAFIDSDCTADSGWLAELVGRFDDPEVGAVGGRVVGMHCSTRLDCYEASMSSLSLGDRELSGGGGDDTFYLPSCNLLVRREAFLEVGGFREGMHVGEDVDLTWRLRNRGLRLVYLPRGWVYHEHRNRIWAFMRRRFEYGTSEALLQVYHPNRRKTLLVPPLLFWSLCLAAASLLTLHGFFSVVAGGLLTLDAWRQQCFLRRWGLGAGFRVVLGARLRTAGSLGYYLAYYLLRYYGIPLLVLSLLWQRFGILVVGIVLGTAGLDFCVHRPKVSFPIFVGFYLLEQIAYGAGVLGGCLQQRAFASYRCVLTGARVMKDYNGAAS